MSDTAPAASREGAARGRVLVALARESLADASRRRVVPVIAVLALLSLLCVDTCSSCRPAVVTDGAAQDPLQLAERIAGFGGLAVTVLLGLWTLVLAGVLASDHLAEPIADGSANLLLARPVSREVFALSRLAGALLLALAAGCLLILGSALLLRARQGLAFAPAWAALGACALGATSVGALAMAASLALPRPLIALFVFAGVFGVAAVNAASQLGAGLAGLPALLDRAGPPLASGMIVALGAWIEPTATRGEPLALLLRALAWAVGSVGALLLAFRRVELGR
jgi:hypothetical protein